MTKITTTIYIDYDLHQLSAMAGINLSSMVEDLIRVTVKESDVFKEERSNIELLARNLDLAKEDLNHKMIHAINTKKLERMIINDPNLDTMYLPLYRKALPQEQDEMVANLAKKKGIPIEIVANVLDRESRRGVK